MGDVAPTHPGEGEEDNLQRETEDDQDLDRPFIPEVQWPSGHLSNEMR